MLPDVFLKRKSRHLARIRDLTNERRQEIDNLQLLEDQYRLDQISKSKPTKQRKTKTRREKFIEQNREVLEPDDLEMLEKIERPPVEIAELLIDVSEAEVRKRLNAEKYKPGRSDRPGAKRTVCTISVVEYMLNGESQEKQ